MATPVLESTAENPTPANPMNSTNHTEARREQARRRLLELETAVGLAGESALAWHVAQAARSGASCAEILDAVQSGSKTGQAPAAALTRSVLNVMRKVSQAQTGWGPDLPVVSASCADPFTSPARRDNDACLRNGDRLPTAWSGVEMSAAS
jgi:hypothetical protein